MPFDAAVAIAQPALSEILATNKIVPVPTEQLAAHKQSQLDKFRPSFWHRHAGLLRIGLLISFTGAAAISAAATQLSEFLPCFIVLGWLAVALASMLRVRAGSHWEERQVAGSCLGRLGVPEPIAMAARQLQLTAPGCALVLGELLQDRVSLDPYLLLVRGNERACLGIWEGGRIIACAGSPAD